MKAESWSVSERRGGQYQSESREVVSIRVKAESWSVSEKQRGDQYQSESRELVSIRVKE